MNMKYSRDDAPPPAPGNDLSARYGLDRLKGSNCDINPFSRLSSRMTWSLGSTTSPRSNRIQTEQSQAQTATRKSVYVSFKTEFKLLSTLLFTEGSSLWSLPMPKPGKNI